MHTYSDVHLTYSLMHSNHAWHVHTHDDPSTTDALCMSPAEPPVYPALQKPRLILTPVFLPLVDPSKQATWQDAHTVLQ